MITAEELGRKAFHLKPEERERLQRECERGIEAEVASKNKEYNLKQALKVGKEAEIIAQIKALGMCLRRKPAKHIVLQSSRCRYYSFVR